MADVLSVKQLSQRIKNTLERDQGFQRVQVQGEISNLTLHRSGHAYFSLKDEQAQINCVMFKSAIGGSFPYSEGEEVVAHGAVTVYVPRGQYQLQVRRLSAVGMGQLYQKFLELKEKLQLEGLFDREHKRPLPELPRTIAVITSPTGAVIQDILNTLNRRFPHLKVQLIPAQVQGSAAIPSLLAAFEVLDNLEEVEVAILARGGGSMEDLWCFNEEALAHTIHQSPVPVISAVGHETDTTIADLVADVRAPTPTAAAELVAPVAYDIRQRLDDLDYTLQQLMQQRIEEERYTLNLLLQRAAQVLPHQLHEESTNLQALLHKTTMAMQAQLHAAHPKLEKLLQKGARAMEDRIANSREELAALEAALMPYDTQLLQKHGLSITLKNNKRVRTVEEVASGDHLTTLLADGSIESTVE